MNLTCCLCLVAYSKSVPSFDVIFKFCSIGVERGLNYLMPNLFSYSPVYLFCTWIYTFNFKSLSYETSIYSISPHFEWSNHLHLLVELLVHVFPTPPKWTLSTMFFTQFWQFMWVFRLLSWWYFILLNIQYSNPLNNIIQLNLMFLWSGKNIFTSRRRWCKMIFQILIQDRDPPFNIWNIIIKFMICLYMGKFIQTIKLSLYILFIFIHFKKNHNSWKNKHFIYLTIKTIFLGGVWLLK